MSDPRRHHYLALSYQKRFTNDQGGLFVYDARLPRRGVFCTTPKNLFHERDLNAVRKPDGGRNTELETWFSMLESDANFVIDKIIAAARSKATPRLNIEEKITWDHFTLFQYKRAPDVFERLGVVQQFVDDIPTHLNRLEATLGRQLTAEERAPLSDERTISRITRNAGVNARGRLSPKVFDALQSKGIAIARVATPDLCFIIGDHPHIRTAGDDLTDPNQELWLPIASDFAVSPWGRPGSEELIDIDRNKLRVFNKWIASNSNIIAARSEALVRNLAGIVGRSNRTMS